MFGVAVKHLPAAEKTQVAGQMDGQKGAEAQAGNCHKQLQPDGRLYGFRKPTHFCLRSSFFPVELKIPVGLEFPVGLEAAVGSEFMPPVKNDKTAADQKHDGNDARQQLE